MSISQQGLKIHIKKKHKTEKEEQQQFPKPCDLCEKIVDSKIKMKQHMKSFHTFTTADYKCEECNFIGTNQFTMEVHFGKTHSESSECGSCDFETKSSEDLKMHLFTCEIYMCGPCDVRFKKLSEVKTHLGENHAGKEWAKIQHGKQNRANSDIISSEYHKYDQLFPEMFKQ